MLDGKETWRRRWKTDLEQNQNTEKWKKKPQNIDMQNNQTTTTFEEQRTSGEREKNQRRRR